MARTKHKGSRSRLSTTRRRWLVVIAIFILGLAVLEISGVTHFFHNKKAVSGIIPATSTASSSNGQAAGSGSEPGNSKPAPAANGNQKSNVSSSDSSVTLLLKAPYGTFVSNHHPSLSGSNGVPSSMQSTCLTTPGAKCYMTFTNSGVTKTLQVQAADENGAVFWDWDVKTAGFTEGSWAVSATASLNGQSLTTKDSLNLEVQP